MSFRLLNCFLIRSLTGKKAAHPHISHKVGLDAIKIGAGDLPGIAHQFVKIFRTDIHGIQTVRIFGRYKWCSQVIYSVLEVGFVCRVKNGIIEPPVSEPRAIGASPAATAAAEPPEEPPGTRSRAMAIVLLPDPLNPVNQIITLCCRKSDSLSARANIRSNMGYISLFVLSILLYYFH